MEFPFKEKQIEKDVFLREFKENIDSEELIWHRDKENRWVYVVESNGWQLQMDNEVPKVLKEGNTYHIPATIYHRVIKGKGNLIVKIKKGVIDG
tara:strand:+ start:636 stop:917 length:282 start_codon:yes stop_codon:yes gene_type:complete